MADAIALAAAKWHLSLVPDFGGAIVTYLAVKQHLQDRQSD